MKIYKIKIIFNLLNKYINVLLLFVWLIGSVKAVNSLESDSASARQVYKNGVIYTVNSDQPWAEAFIVEEGVITYVGDNGGADARTNSQSQIIDLKGRIVLPGIHDVHAHPLEAGSPVGGTCTLPSNTNPEDMTSLLEACAPKQIGTDWVLGFGYSIHNILESERNPIDILDEAIPHQPAIMMGETSHSVWVNSKALEVAGIGESSTDIPGGVVMLDDSGKPNGLLLENAGNFLMNLALQPTPELEQLNYEGLLYGLEQLAKYGITSVADARVYWMRNHHKAWLRAERENTLTARAVLGLWASPHLEDQQQIATLKSLYRSNPDDLLRINQIKVYSDGLIDNTTAAVFEPYLIDLEIFKGNRGMNYFDQNRLSKYLAALQGTGFDFHIHTIGDRGVHQALNAIEETGKPENGYRHRLTHLELIDKKDRARFSKLGVIADFQVAGDFTLPHHWQYSAELIGKRAFDTIPVKSILKTGAKVTLSSDWDVSTLNPFVGIENALKRKHQSISLEDAIKMYTINGAFALRQEDKVGSLEQGKLADFIVINQNIFEISPNNISNTKVLLTVLEGEVIYRHQDF